MPGFDGSGPQGFGPMTGRGMGYCGPGEGPAAGGGPVFGRGRGGLPRGGGRGFGFGGGRGGGRGFGRGMGYGRRFGGPAQAAGYYGNPGGYAPDAQAEKEMLQDEVGALEARLDEIRQRISELEQSED